MRNDARSSQRSSPSTISGTGIAAGTQVVSQLSGTPGGVGTYALSIPSQNVASTAVSGTYGTLTVTAITTGTIGVGTVIGHLSAAGSHCAPATCLHWGLLEGERYLDPLTLLPKRPVRLLPLSAAGDAGLPGVVVLGPPLDPGRELVLGQVGERGVLEDVAQAGPRGDPDPLQDDGTLVVPFDKGTVHGAPKVKTDVAMTKDLKERLVSYYGVSTN